VVGGGGKEGQVSSGGVGVVLRDQLHCRFLDNVANHLQVEDVVDIEKLIFEIPIVLLLLLRATRSLDICHSSQISKYNNAYPKVKPPGCKKIIMRYAASCISNDVCTLWEPKC
jgi:hypothetical protein